MIPKENFLKLEQLNRTQEREIQKLRSKNSELEQKIELLKKFSILGEFINEKKFICNLR